MNVLRYFSRQCSSDERTAWLCFNLHPAGLSLCQTYAVSDSAISRGMTPPAELGENAKAQSSVTTTPSNGPRSEQYCV